MLAIDGSLIEDYLAIDGLTSYRAQAETGEPKLSQRIVFAGYINVSSFVWL